MTLESLDIRRVPWTPGRVALHMALATDRIDQPDTAFPRGGKPARRKRRWWPLLLALYGTPTALAISMVVALWVLRHGL